MPHEGGARPGEQDAGDGERQPRALEGEQQPRQRRAGEQPHRLDRARQDVGGGEVGRVVDELGEHGGLRRPEHHDRDRDHGGQRDDRHERRPCRGRAGARDGAGRGRPAQAARPRRPVDEGADRGTHGSRQRSADEDGEPDRRAASGVVGDDGQADGRRPGGGHDRRPRELDAQHVGVVHRPPGREQRSPGREADAGHPAAPDVPCAIPPPPPAASGPAGVDRAAVPGVLGTRRWPRLGSCHR